MKRNAEKPSEVEVQIGPLGLAGDLLLPAGETREFILFAHGSGSSRHSPRNRYAAERLRQAGFGTLLMDLLTPEEEEEKTLTRHLRFDIGLLAGRLIEATDWIQYYSNTTANSNRDLRIGYFGSSTGAAAALAAASKRFSLVQAVVSRGGRPDLAGRVLREVKAPVLLIVGGEDKQVIALNRQAFEKLGTRQKELVIVPGAGHLFEESGTLEAVTDLACGWFEIYLGLENHKNIQAA